MKLTKHAQSRCQQRAIRDAHLSIVIAHGIESPAENGCTKVWLCERVAKQLIQQIQKATNVAVIISPNDEIITTFRALKGGRHA
jgi:hypothetical protein